MPRNHMLGQWALASLVERPLRAAWSDLDPSDLRGSLPPLKAATAAIVTQYGKASSAAALQFYRGARTRAGVTGRPSLPMAPSPDPDKVDASVAWATAGLWTPDVGPDLLDSVFDLVVGVAERYVLNQGRDTLIGAVHSDSRASGWARVAEGDACAFCAMLTSAGAHYKSEDSGDFEAHDHCACSVEPVFDTQEYQPDERTQAWSDLYAESTAGHLGDDKLTAFRAAFDARAAEAP